METVRIEFDSSFSNDDELLTYIDSILIDSGFNLDNLYKSVEVEPSVQHFYFSYTVKENRELFFSFRRIDDYKVVIILEYLLVKSSSGKERQIKIDFTKKQYYSLYFKLYNRLEELQLNPIGSHC
jgi:hypothetical protein